MEGSWGIQYFLGILLKSWPGPSSGTLALKLIQSGRSRHLGSEQEDGGELEEKLEDPLWDPADSRCVSPGQMIHLEIESGRGVAPKPGQALGNRSRASSRPDAGRAAGSRGTSFRGGVSVPSGGSGSRVGPGFLLLRAASRAGSFTDHPSFYQ